MSALRRLRVWPLRRRRGTRGWQDAPDFLFPTSSFSTTSTPHPLIPLQLLSFNLPNLPYSYSHTAYILYHTMDGSTEASKSNDSANGSTTQLSPAYRSILMTGLTNTQRQRRVQEELWESVQGKLHSEDASEAAAAEIAGIQLEQLKETERDYMKRLGITRDEWYGKKQESTADGSAADK